MKIIQKERIRGAKHIQHVKNEKQILKDMTVDTHKKGRKSASMSFFVDFIESMQDDYNLYLLLEYLPGGELLE